MFLIDASKYAAEVKRIGSDRNGSDAQLDRYHKINNSFKRLVPIAPKSARHDAHRKRAGTNAKASAGGTNRTPGQYLA